MTTPIRALAAGTLAVLFFCVGACSSGSESGASDAEAPASRVVEGGSAAEAEPPAEGADTGSDTVAAPGVNRAVVRVRSVIRTGQVVVTNKDVAAARSELTGVLDTLGGDIDHEQTQSDAKGRMVRATVTVRVPVDRFQEAMTALGELGKVKRSESSSRDVTAEVIDVDERVQTLANSLDRLQGFQDDAKSIDDLIRYENEITEREAELQSMRSQQAYLRDQTTMSTITVTIERPAAKPKPPAEDDDGFLAGLESGWNALRGSAVVVLTIVGAVIPFAVVLALVGVPLWLLVRRLAVRRTAATPPAPATPPTE